jgi:hypothetical protein
MWARGLNVHEVFIRVGQDVRKATNLKQVPWTTGTLSYAYYFVPDFVRKR